jgi:hypothetical protein
MFELLKITQVSVPTFLEFVISGLTINLAIAVDFSRPETPVDEAAIRRYVDNVETIITTFSESLHDFSYVIC